MLTILIMSIKDGIKSKYKDYDRLDEVVDFLLSHSSIDWASQTNPKILLPPIIREELDPYMYTRSAKCYNEEITNIYYRVATCEDSWQFTTNHPKREIALVNNAKCKRCGDTKVYRNYSKREITLQKRKSDLRYICLTCGHSDREYEHYWCL